MKVMHDGRLVTVVVSADGEGLVSRAGSALLAGMADKTGLTRAIGLRLASAKERRAGHDWGAVVRDLAVMIADGGECLADLRGLRDQRPLFGMVASDSTAYRVIERIATDPALLSGLRAARAVARSRAWELGAKPERVTIDQDATFVTAHSLKDGAAGHYKGGFGFAPLMVYLEESGEALAGLLRPGNRGANNAADQVAASEIALAQIPEEHIEQIPILLRMDSAGATHELIDWCRDGRIHFSVGYGVTGPVRAGTANVPEDAWVSALDQDGKDRPNGQVAELTGLVDLSRWPEGSRLICRRERAHPGAQLSFIDHDGYRFQTFLTDQPDPDIAVLERRQRQRAHAEDHIRRDKDTGLAKLPFRDFQMNQVWVELVLIAHDLIRWTQTLLLEGELAKAEPKRLRYRLLHVAARLAFHGRTARLRLQAHWPWGQQLLHAFTKLKLLPAPAS